MQIFIGLPTLIFSLSFIFTTVTWASEVDQKFISTVVNNSQCSLDREILITGFSQAIDRLEKINPFLASYIRMIKYQQPLKLECDLSNESNVIYYSADGLIHLRQGAGNDWKTTASFFHEFLHFVGVMIDEKYHADPKMEDLVEVDNVYACHLAVFPELLEFLKMDPSRLPTARARCANAPVGAN